MPNANKSKNYYKNTKKRVRTAMRLGQRQNSSEVDDLASNFSDESYSLDEDYGLGSLDDAKFEDNVVDDQFEDNLKDSIDMATQKSASTRVKALEGLNKAFTKRLVSDFIEDRYVTLSDIVEKSIKKGKGSEQIFAANLASLLVIQLGSSPTSEKVNEILQPVLSTVLTDSSVSYKVRASIAHAYGLCSFVGCEELNDIVKNMDTLEKIFSASYGREKPESNVDIINLHTACLSTWTLLMTLIPPPLAYKTLESHVENLGTLLDSNDVDLRIAAGEAIVMLVENAVDHNEEGSLECVDYLIPKLKQLATDSAKYRSKKDRKEQRHIFRDIFKYLDDNIDYEDKIIMNPRETLIINAWYKKKQYDSICKALASGTNLHLAENAFVRDVFELGAPIIPSKRGEAFDDKPTKFERNLAKHESAKLRSQTRGKVRTKRYALV